MNELLPWNSKGINNKDFNLFYYYLWINVFQLI